MKFFLFFCSLFLFCLQKEIYINSNGGNDSNGCGTLNLPCKTISYSLKEGGTKLFLFKGDHYLSETIIIKEKEIKISNYQNSEVRILCSSSFLGFLIKLSKSFILTDITISKCKGAIKIEESKSELKNVKIIDNQNRIGGGLNILNSFVDISYSLFYLNKAIENTNGIGGAIFIDNSDVNITKSEFKNNFALEKAGAVSIREANSRIEDCLFYENSVPKGPGIYHSGALNLDAVTSFLMKNTSFIKNKAQNFGALSGTGVISISKCIFKENISHKENNCILDLDFAKIYDSIIENNQGCGLSTTQCEVIGCRIMNNKGTGLLDSETKRSRSLIQNSFIYNNQGTGLELLNSRVEVIGLTIDKNHGRNGGGISAINLFSNSIIKDSTIQNNLANLGGALFIHSNLNILNLKLLNNKAINGSGIYLDNSIINSDTISIINNNSTRGGGIFISNSKLSFKNLNNIRNNYALNGGGIYCLNSELIGSPQVDQNRENNYQCSECNNCQ